MRPIVQSGQHQSGHQLYRNILISIFTSVLLSSLCLLLLLATFFNQPALAANPDRPSQAAQPDSGQPDIVGGRESEPGAWPWQVVLVRSYYSDAYDGMFCGGTLIAPQWVLTAGHCADIFSDPTDIDVILGRHGLSDSDGQRVNVQEILIHPGYEGSLRDPDLALLYLSEAVTFTTVTIDTAGTISAENRSLNATTTGWGRYLDSSYYPSNVLREVEIPLQPLSTCRTAFYYLSDYVTNNQICTGYGKGSIGPCHGDSGGPLLIPSDDGTSWIQVGITSWGNGYCYGDYYEDNYSIYTRISSFEPWIRACVNDPLSSACLGGDATEPDDATTTASLLSTAGVSQTHNFHRRGDVDWLQFNATADKIYLIETFDLGFNTDTILWLFDSDGKHAITYSDDVYQSYYYGDKSSYIRWKAAQSGVYYLKVENHWRSGNTERSYRIRANEFSNESFMPVISNRWVQYPTATPSFVETLIALPVPLDTPTPTTASFWVPTPQPTPTP